MLLDALSRRIELIGGAGRSRIEEGVVRQDQAGDPTEGLTDRRRNDCATRFAPPGASPAAPVASNAIIELLGLDRRVASLDHRTLSSTKEGSGGDHRKDRRSRSVEGGRLDAPSVAALRS